MSDVKDEQADERSAQPSPPSTVVGEVPAAMRPPENAAGPATIVGTVPGLPGVALPNVMNGQQSALQPPPAGPIPYHMPPTATAPPQSQWAGHATRPASGRGSKWRNTAATTSRFVRFHVQRAVTRDLRALAVSPQEAPVLAAQGVRDHTIQQYLIWRRSWLYLLLPLAVVAAIIQIAALLSQEIDLSDITWFGIFVLGTTVVLQMVGYPVAAGLAVWKWDDLRFSRWALLAGWFASYLLPFLVALIPFGNFVLSEETDPQIIAQERYIAGIVGAIIWLSALLPALLAIMPGILRASVRIKSLLPESIVPGWIIVMTAPFFTLVLMVVFVSVNQVAGNLLLIFGVLLIMASPAVFLIRTDLLIRPVTSPTDRHRLETMQVVYVAMIGLGLAFLMAYFFTLEILGQPLVGNTADPINPAMVGVGRFSWEVTSFVITYAAKSVFMTAVAIDLFMLLNLSVWKNLKAFQDTPHADAYDRTMASFQQLAEGKDNPELPFASSATRAFEVVPPAATTRVDSNERVR